MSRKTYLQNAARLLGIALAGWLIFRFLGPIVLPFLLGYLVARAAEPAIAVLQQRTALPRWLAAGLCVTAIYAVLAGSLWFLSLVLYEQFCGFARSLPALAEALTEPADTLRRWLLSAARRFPDGIGVALALKIESFFRSGAGLPSRVYQWLFSLVTSLVAKLPSLTLFLMTAVLSSFMLASQLTNLRDFWRKKAPGPWQQRAASMAAWCRTSLLGWLRAQLRLMGVTFLVLTAGLLILGIDYAFLFGLLIALLDALPVFGAGAVLIPWAAVLLIRRQTVRGLGLLGLYGVVLLLRTTLEPRMLGKQLGLSPLVTLLSIYAGYRLFGFFGMVLAPMVMVLLKQVWEQAEKQIDNQAFRPDNKSI